MDTTQLWCVNEDRSTKSIYEAHDIGKLIQGESDLVS